MGTGLSHCSPRAAVPRWCPLPRASAEMSPWAGLALLQPPPALPARPGARRALQWHWGTWGDHSRVRRLPGFLGMKEKATPKLPHLQDSSGQQGRAALTLHPGGSSLGLRFYTKTLQHSLLEKQNEGEIKTTEMQISDTGIWDPWWNCQQRSCWSCQEGSTGGRGHGDRETLQCLDTASNIPYSNKCPTFQ